jgi:hypothetical protein
MMKLTSEEPGPFALSLEKQTVAKPIEFLTMLTAVIGLAFLGWQLSKLNENLESQAYSYIENQQLELDKIFIEHPNYRQFFYDGVSLPTGDGADARQILAIAELKLDVIDAFYSQADHINWAYHHTFPAWERYHEGSFLRSQIMCREICRYWNEYGTHIRAVAKRPNACGDTLKLTAIAGTADMSCSWVAPK